MGEAERGVSRPAAVADPIRIGAYLARERRLRRITLDELAAATRVPRRSLERLEAGAYDESPDGFARGFVRTVALALGLRPQDTLARMLPEAGAQVPETRSRRRMPRWRTCVGVVACLAVGAAIALGARRLLSTPAEPDPVVYRLDAVRELWLETAQTESIASDAGRLEPELPSAGAPGFAGEPVAETRSLAAD